MNDETPLTPAESLRRITTLASGDAMARAFSFVAFVYLARILGTGAFGVLEFATTVLLYATLVADAGLEAWGSRAVAQASTVRTVVARVTGLRLVFAAFGFLLLLAVLPLLPDTPQLHKLVIVMGLTLLPQALSLKWLFMGRQQMRLVALGSVAANAAFLVGVILLASDPDSLLVVGWIRLATEAGLAGYFMLRFVAQHGKLPRPRLAGARADIGSILTLGASSAMSMINYNFDALLLGLMSGATAVGLYAAAYKPVTVALSIPMTFFIGLFPALAGAYANDRATFRTLVGAATLLTSVVAVPLAVAGALLARPLILTLFGEPYAPAIPVLQLLAWSLIPVMLRGTFRQGLKVAGHERVELVCAAIAAGLNIVLNLYLIPRFGMLGAAAATLAAELVWVTLVANRMTALVIDAELGPQFWRPAVAGVAMAAALYLTGSVPWVARGALGLGVYAAVIVALGGVTPKQLRALRGP